eukprot:gene31661-39111_t
MTTAVCHQAAAIIFANFEGVWEKSVARSENSVTIQTFREEVFSEGPSTAWMGTVWQYVDNKAPFAPHTFTIHRSEDRMFRLWSAYADAYSGGFTLNNWLEDPPGWGWSVFAGGVSMKEKDFELFFTNSAISYDRNAVQDDRIAADWATWMPDSLFGYTWSYGYGYTNDTSYQVAYFKTSGTVTDERSVWLSSCLTVQLSSCPAVWLSSCLAV